MIAVVRWVEQGGLSFLKGEKYDTKDSVCWFFPVIFVITKEMMWLCAEVVAFVISVKGASKRSIIQGKWGATQGTLVFQNFLL